MEFLKTADGSLTVRHDALGELYHSDRGAVGEAEHVYIRAGLEWAFEKRGASKEISVFEAGFGTGLNCWLTYLQACGKSAVNYHAIELYPIDLLDVAKFNYTSDLWFGELHNLPWDGRTYRISDYFSLTKYKADLLSFDFVPLAGCFDVVYFDAFSPDVQPELWTEDVMVQMYAILKPGGVLVTYSSKGSVKQALRTVGFEVMRLPGALGKRHMVRAVKPLN